MYLEYYGKKYQAQRVAATTKLSSAHFEETIGNSESEMESTCFGFSSVWVGKYEMPIRTLKASVLIHPDQDIMCLRYPKL